MYPRKSQWSLRADGYGSPMPPSAFAKPTPTAKAKPLKPVTPAPKSVNPPSKQPGASIDGNKNAFVPQGSGASASFGGSMSGGSGSILGML